MTLMPPHSNIGFYSIGIVDTVTEITKNKSLVLTLHCPLRPLPTEHTNNPMNVNFTESKAWFLWSGEVGESRKNQKIGKSWGIYISQSGKSKGQAKSGKIKVPGCKS